MTNTGAFQRGPIRRLTHLGVVCPPVTWTGHLTRPPPDPPLALEAAAKPSRGGQNKADGAKMREPPYRTSLKSARVGHFFCRVHSATIGVRGSHSQELLKKLHHAKLVKTVLPQFRTKASRAEAAMRIEVVHSRPV